ncbi:hypothetical protein Tco_0670901 [Tanacetum coccineum]
MEKVGYEHVAMNNDSSGISYTNRREYLQVEFQRISLTGFRSCASRSHYRSISKQTTLSPYEASHGHKIEKTI